MEQLSADNPIKLPRQDLLGFNPLASSLAKNLLSISTSNTGLVIGINGEWGCGKTSFLELVKYNLVIEKAMEPIKIINYNPWVIFDENQLIKEFFLTLTNNLSNRSKLKKIVETLADSYAEMNTKWNFLLKFFKKKSKSIYELKGEIEKELMKQNENIIVIIDDIDRLSKNEIKTVIKLVKSVANFPNIIYLLAFDKKVVASAISENHLVDGQQYLEKIVQVEYDLPILSEFALEKLFLEKLNKIFNTSNSIVFNDIYWGNVYFDGIKPILKNIRQISRLVNSITLSISSIINEVNVVDFIGLETIKIFYSEIYELIKTNKKYFVGYIDVSHQFSDPSFDELKLFFDNNLKNIDRPVKDLISRMFPIFEAVERNFYYGNESLIIWKDERRICHKDLFDIYFSFSLPINQIGRIEMLNLLESIKDYDEIKKNIESLISNHLPDGNRKIRLFLKNLINQELNLDANKVENLILSLVNWADKIIEVDNQVGYRFEPSNRNLLNFVIEKNLLIRQDLDIHKILNSVIEKSDNFSLVFDILLIIGRRNGKYPSESNKNPSIQEIELNILEDLEKLILKRLKENSETISESPLLESIIYWWNLIEDKSASRSFLEEIVKNTHKFEKIINNSKVYHIGGPITDRTHKITYFLNLNWIEEILGKNEVKGYLETYIKDDSAESNLKILIKDYLSQKF